MTGEPDRQWLREAFGALAREWREFFVTVLAFTLAPRRAAAEWADGTRDAPNPALYTLNAIAIQTPWTLLWNHLAGVHEIDVPLWSQALASSSEFFQVLIWTLPLHGALYFFGGRRPLRTTYGVILYVTAGPLTMLALLLVPLLAFGANRIDPQHVTPAMVRVALATLLATLVVVVLWVAYAALAVAGAHRLKLGRVLSATSFILISALVFMGWFGRHHPAIGHALGMTR